MYTDSHIHTCHFSPDAEMSIKELIEALKKNNIRRAAITEHYELDYPHPDDPLSKPFDIGDYQETFDSWKNKARTLGIELLMGIEFGYQPHIANQISKLSKVSPFDSVILSNHIFRGKDIYFSTDCYDIPSAERNREYISVLVQMASECEGYDIIGHFDYINRYSKDRYDRVLYSDAPDEFDSLFEILINRNKALEINTSSITAQRKKQSAFAFPDPDILKRYKAMGGELISLGSDAHTKGAVGAVFEQAGQFLRSVGFDQICYFRKHVPCTEPL